MTGLPEPSPIRDEGEGLDDVYDAEIIELFDTQAGRLFGYLLNAGADPSYVDDLVQEAFLTTRQQWHRVRRYDKPAAYLYKVAANQLVRVKRRHHLLEIPTADPHDGHRSAAAQTNGPELGRTLNEALATLPPRQHQVVLLHYVYGFDIATAGEILGISSGTVKRHLFDARHRLADTHKIDIDGWEGGDNQ